MRCLPAEVCTVLCHELPRAPHLDAALGLIEAVRQAIASVTGCSPSTSTPRRTAHRTATPSSCSGCGPPTPSAYPVGGRKRKTMTPWTRQLLRGGELFVGEGDAVLREVFDDHARIASLGLHAVLNVPLLDAGRCLATFNVLGSRRSGCRRSGCWCSCSPCWRRRGCCARRRHRHTRPAACLGVDDVRERAGSKGPDVVESDAEVALVVVLLDVADVRRAQHVGQAQQRDGRRRVTGSASYTSTAAKPGRPRASLRQRTGR